jgi:hypothetical protein
MDTARLQELKELLHLPDEPAGVRIKSQSQSKLKEPLHLPGLRGMVNEYLADYPDPCHLVWHGEEVHRLRRRRVTAQTPATLSGTVNEFLAWQTDRSAEEVKETSSPAGPSCTDSNANEWIQHYRCSHLNGFCPGFEILTHVIRSCNSADSDHFCGQVALAY